MCTIHQRRSKDLKTEFFEKFFADPILKGLKSINITGGEPTLRKDLSQLVGMICNHCKQLREVIISTNGLDSQRIKEHMEKLHRALTPGIKNWVYVSLDSLDEKAELMRGVKNASSRALDSVLCLKEMKKSLPNLEVGVQCTITALNYTVLKDVYEFAKEEGLYIDFSYATVNTAYINSKPNADKFILDQNQKKQLIAFLEKVSTYERMSLTKDYYAKLIDRLRGLKGAKECIFRQRRGLLLEADGNVRVCGMAEESYLGNLHVDSLQAIMTRDCKDLDRFCETCETNSYYAWSATAQKDIGMNMLSNVRRRLENARRSEKDV